MSKGFGRTMGQDWGGRRKSNPDNAPRVTRIQVEKFAEEHGYEIEREGYWWASDMWKGRIKGTAVWRTLGQTNYLALEQLKYLVSEEKKNE